MMSDDNERLCALEPCLRLKRSSPQTGLVPGTARSDCNIHSQKRITNFSQQQMSLMANLQVKVVKL